MVIIAETYIELMKNPAHLGAEATVTVLENIITILICRPIFKRWLAARDAKRDAHKHCEDVHNDQGELFDENGYNRKSTPVSDQRPYVGGSGWNERRYKRLGRKGY